MDICGIVLYIWKALNSVNVHNQPSKQVKVHKSIMLFFKIKSQL